MKIMALIAYGMILSAGVACSSESNEDQNVAGQTEGCRSRSAALGLSINSKVNTTKAMLSFSKSSLAQPVLVMRSLLASQAAYAWGPSESTLQDLAHDSTNQLMNMQILEDVQSSAQNPNPPMASDPTDSATIGSQPAQSTAAAAAKRYPATQQKEAEDYFCGLLGAYGKLAPQMGLHPYDLAGGLAMFIAANFMAYSGHDLKEEDFKTLALQMKSAILGNTGLKKLSNEEKGTIHEQMVLLGMNMSALNEMLKQQPNPELNDKMKKAAEDYLESFLQVDASKVHIGSKGLSIQ